MNYVLSHVNFPSTDGKSTVHCTIYEPKGEVRGVVQLSHGMLDYVGRYTALADYLTARGYVLAGNDHLGHGGTAECDKDLGFFADKDGITCLLRDLHAMNKLLRERYHGMKPVILGHSMGSFLSRLYVEKYPNSVSGHIIHGTGGPMAILPLGKALVNTVILFCGKRHRSSLVASMAFAGYNSKFDKSEGKHAWLTRDASMIAERDEDRLQNFTFTVSAYRDLFRMVGSSNSKKWFKEYPTAMRTLVMSGDADPVGAYGKAPRYVYKQLLVSGAEDIKLLTYEGARHELFNETCREQVFADIVSWLNNGKL